MTKNTIIISNMKLKGLFKQLTPNQRHKIYEQNLIPMWESQCWFAWVDAKGNNTDSTTEFCDNIRNSAKKHEELERREDLITFITKDKQKVLFISPDFDKFLSEKFNRDWDYELRNINKLVNKINTNSGEEQLKEYIKKYHILKDNLPNWVMTNDEIKEYCEACDNFPEFINKPGFLLHNALQWI